MRRPLLSMLATWSCLCLAPLFPAWSQPGDVNQPSSSDGAVIIYHRPPPAFGGPPSQQTWYKRGDTVRIDAYGRDVMVQRYTRSGQTVDFALTRSRDGRLQALALRDDPVSALPVTAMRTFTGVTEEHLGKHCRIWQVVHEIRPKLDIVQSGCVTADGIELWWHEANIGTITATSITYKAVADSEVRPPIEVFDLRAWTPPDANHDHQHDYRVDLGGTGYFMSKLSQLKSGPWLSMTTESASGGKSVSLLNAADGLTVSYWENLKGDRSLSIVSHGKFPLEAYTLGRGVRLDTRADDAVLGERCQWWNTMPNVADIGREECQTDDAIPLIVTTSARGRMDSSVVAERLSRSPQPLSSVMPDKQILTPGFWGF